MNNRYISVEIAKLKNLPLLPKASSQIISAVNDPDIAIEKLAEVISASPVLAGRLLGLANSAYFGRTGQISDLRVAIIRVLGMSLVKSIALSLVLNAQLDVSQCKAFNSESYWVNALLTAMLAQKISQLIRPSEFDPAIVYTSGLLLNIGMIVAVYLFPSELNKLLATERDSELSLAQRMMREFGMDQYQLGSLLLQRWQLPEIYQTVLKQFNNRKYQGQEQHLLELLRIASELAEQIYLSRSVEDQHLHRVGKIFNINEALLRPVITNVLEKLDDLNELAITISGK